MVGQTLEIKRQRLTFNAAGGTWTSGASKNADQFVNCRGARQIVVSIVSADGVNMIATNGLNTRWSDDASLSTEGATNVTLSGKTYAAPTLINTPGIYTVITPINGLYIGALQFSLRLVTDATTGAFGALGNIVVDVYTYFDSVVSAPGQPVG